MQVVLITARAPEAAQHWSRAMAPALAARLAAREVPVRWLCPVDDPADAPAAAAGVTVLPVPGALSSFRHVQRRVVDARLDRELALELRPRRDVAVVHIGFGAPGSATTLWLAERMGARPVAVVRAAELVCHRRDLVEHGGAPCTVFTDARRCARCCGAAQRDGREGLGPLQARVARWLRPLGGLRPFPTPIQFVTRTDQLLSSLLVAETFTFGEAERGKLLEFGLVGRAVRVLDGAGHEACAAALADHLLAGPKIPPRP